MRHITLPLLIFTILLSGYNTSTAQTPIDRAMPTTPQIDIHEYVGEYTRTDGTPVYIVAAEGKLAAVVSGNVFLLAPTGSDTFELMGVAETVHFERNDGGSITATADSKGSYPRKTTAIPYEVRAMFGSHEAITYVYSPPTAGEASIQPVAAAGSHGVSPDSLTSIVTDIYNDADYANIHSLLLTRGGTLILEEYFAGFDASQHHNLRSATKSIISTLVGIALQRGEITLDDKPLKHIAEQAFVPISVHKAQLSLSDLLDMRHGLQCDDWDAGSPGNESKLYGTADWTTAILNIPDATASTGATYCSAMPLMVGRYLELVTGISLPDYADRVLFRPLGMARTDWEWNFALSASENALGAQVHLRPRDMLRIGQLYERDGLSANGERLLPPGWVAQAFNAEVPLGDWRRYNDFWWAYDVERGDGNTVTVHMASGIGG